MLVDINLLPKKEPKNYALLAITFVVLLLFLVAGALIFWQGTALQTRLNLLENQINTTKSLTEAEQAKLGNNQAVNLVAELEAAVNWANNEPIKAVPIIKQVTALLPHRGFIQTISYSELGAVNLTIQFDTNRDAAYYLKNLLDSEWITEVKLTSLTTSDDTTKTESEGTNKADNQYVPRYIGQYQLMLDRDFINKYEKDKLGGNGS